MKHSGFIALMVLALATMLTVPAAQAASVLYTFSGTTYGSFPTPAHPETFQLTLSDFLPVTDGGPVVSIQPVDPGLLECAPCATSGVPVLHFLSSTSSDLVQFVDADGATRLYTFPSSALTTPGTYQTLFGINVNRGTLSVTATPEPSTFALVALACGFVVVRKRNRNSPVVDGRQS